MKGLVGLIFGNASSKLLALLREVLFAAWFGTSDTAVAYRVALSAFTIPIQGTVAEALSTGIIPLYNRLKEGRKGEEQAVATCALFGGLIISTLFLTLFFFAANPIVGIFAPGLDIYTAQKAATLLQIMGLAAPFYILGGTLSNIEAAHGRLRALSVRPLLMNVVALLGAAAAHYSGFSAWLAWALLAGHAVFFCQSAFWAYRVKRTNKSSPSTPGSLSKIAPTIVAMTLPLVLLPLVAQANLAVERIVTSWIDPQLIPSVDYARFIMDTWVNVLALPFSVYTIARYGGLKLEQSAADKHSRAMFQGLLLISFPIGLITALNAHSIVALIFERGAFDVHASIRTSSVLTWLGIALPLVVCSYYLIRVLLSKMLTYKAFTCMLFASFCNSAFNLTFWAHFGQETIGIGVLIYGISMLAAAIFTLGYQSSLLKLMWIVVPVSLVGIACHVSLSQILPRGALALASAGAILSIWMLTICLNRDAIIALQPILSRLSRFRMFRRNQ